MYEYFTEPPEECSLCVWSWSNLVGAWFCKLCLNPEECGGPVYGKCVWPPNNEL